MFRCEKPLAGWRDSYDGDLHVCKGRRDAQRSLGFGMRRCWFVLGVFSLVRTGEAVDGWEYT